MIAGRHRIELRNRAFLSSPVVVALFVVDHPCNEPDVDLFFGCSLQDRRAGASASGFLHDDIGGPGRGNTVTSTGRITKVTNGIRNSLSRKGTAWYEPPFITCSRIPFCQFPPTLSFCDFDPFSIPTVYICLGFQATPSYRARLPAAREGMHCYL